MERIEARGAGDVGYAAGPRDGVVQPDRLAKQLRVTKRELAATLGLGRDALSRRDRIAAPKTQARLRDLIGILDKVEPTIGSSMMAYAWFRSIPLSGYGGKTAEDLVRAGRARSVHAHIDRVLAGGFALTSTAAMRFTGPVYRAINPRWAGDPLSGKGACLHGGRFNQRGRPALYTAMSPHTALREIDQILGRFQPILVCQYEVDIEPVFDARDPDIRRAEGVDWIELDCPDWQDLMDLGQTPPSHALAERLVAAGYVAMLAPSFAHGAEAGDTNLVLWKWGDDLPARVRLVDDQGRLAPYRGSGAGAGGRGGL